MKKRIAFLCMLCGVLVLSGCGGASSSRVNDLEDRVNSAEALVEELRASLRVAETEAETQKTRAETARLEAQTAQTRLEEAEANTQKAVADKEAVEADLAQARLDLAAAQTALTQARADLATAQTALTQARAALTAAQTAAQAEQARQQAEQEEQQRQAAERLSEVQQAVRNARAGVFIGELMGTIPRRGDDTATSSVTVRWMRGDSREVDPGGNFSAGSGAPSISGFNSYPFTRRVGVQGAETAYLYTNIQSLSTRRFWKVYGLDEGLVADNLSLAKPGSSTAQKIYTGPSDARVLSERRVSGSFRGANGTFTCETTGGSETACGGNADNTATTHIETVDGVREFASGAAGNWTFEPSSINNGVTINHDDAYLYFGIWERMPDVASEPHDFAVIYGGGGVDSDGDRVTALLTNAADLTGSATFRGGAIGKYVTRNQVGQNARIGTFTANADFTADFDADTLEGRITNFQADGQRLAGWDVYLGASATLPATTTTPTTLAAATASGSTAARIGSVAATGTWTANLYGSVNVDLGDTEDHPRATYPRADLAGLAGSFSATDATDLTDPDTANAAIAGAFAATPATRNY